MDPLYYSRIAMSGWVFVATFLLSLCAGNSPYWNQLIEFVKSSNSAITVAVFGAIIGIGGPPAFGFLIERIVWFFVWLARLTLWEYKSVKLFGDSLAETLTGKLTLQSSKYKGALFHAFFYTYGNKELLEWARRRRTHMYASFTSAFAILLGVACAKGIYDAYSLIVCAVSAILVGMLIGNGFREYMIHKQTISAWVETLGPLVSTEFSGRIRRMVDTSIENQRSV